MTRVERTILGALVNAYGARRVVFETALCLEHKAYIDATMTSDARLRFFTEAKTLRAAAKTLLAHK